MPLYTIIVGFCDYTSGIEQYESDSPHKALATFLEKAESLESYDKDAVAQLIESGEQINLVHAANELRGFWIWVPVLVDDPRTESILGAYVIQTDHGAPKRLEGT